MVANAAFSKESIGIKGNDNVSTRKAVLPLDK